MFCAQYKVPVFVLFSSGGEGNWTRFISLPSMNQLTSEAHGIFQPLQHTQLQAWHSRVWTCRARLWPPSAGAMVEALATWKLLDLSAGASALLSQSWAVSFNHVVYVFQILGNHRKWPARVCIGPWEPFGMESAMLAACSFHGLLASWSVGGEVCTALVKCRWAGCLVSYFIL